MSRLVASQRAWLAPSWVREELSRKAQALPSLDLRFAESKSLTDAASGANLVTFTRSSSGTYVGSDGVLKTATTNLLVQSNQFDTAWTNTGTVETASQAIAPDGTNTGWKLVDNSVNTNHNIFQSVNWVAGPVTFSAFVKYLDHRWIGIRLFGISFGSWDLLNGVVGSASAGATLGMQSVGNGWYRITMTATSITTTSNLIIGLNPADVTSLSTYSGTGTGIYLWGAQLEQSSTVGEYIPTTSTINSAPRFDHNPTTGESLGLLVEEQRTNSCLQSNGFDTTWANTASAETAGQAISPDGSNNGWKLVTDTTNSGHNIFIGVAWTAATWSVSFFAKYLDHRWVVVRFGATGNQFFGSWDLQNGATGAATAGATINIQPFVNGWYRLTLTATLTTAGTGNLVIGLNNVDAAGLATFTGTGTGIYLYGVQAEAGSFPTSYIPTTTATATRSADVASITGTNFSSWYRQDEGTVFADVNSAPVNNIAQLTYDISEGVGSDRMFQRRNASGIVATAVLDNGVTQGDIGSVVIGASARYRSGFAYKLNDLEIIVNGGGSATDTSATMPTPDRLHIGQNYASGQSCNGTLRRLTFWSQRLPSSTLQAITQ